MSAEIKFYNINKLQHTQAHREGGGGGILPRGPQTFKVPREAFIFMIFAFMGCIFMQFRYLSLSWHCLDSMSERLGRIISNAFTVSVDKLFNPIDHVK